MRTWTIFAILLLFGIRGFAQASASVVAGPGASATAPIMATFRPPVELFEAVTGEPYSGAETHTPIRIRADGTQIIEPTRRMFRDSLGRLRIERTLVYSIVGGPSQPVMIEIWDPVAGFKFTLDTANKVAHRNKLPIGPTSSSGAVIERVNVPPPAPDPSRPQSVIESLGTRMIEGVSAEGQLETVTIPAGYQGSNHAAVNTNEIWRSPELKIALVTKTKLVSSQTSEQEIRITNLSRSEPPAELFSPPSDYKLVDETEIFRINAGSPPPPVPLPQVAPVLIEKSSPEYTRAARVAKIQGVVTLAFTISTDGVPNDIRVVQSLDPGLDQSAVDAVSRWRYRPGLRDGHPVEVKMTLQVNFRL
jgi:TonB family protein